MPVVPACVPSHRRQPFVYTASADEGTTVIGDDPDSRLLGLELRDSCREGLVLQTKGSNNFYTEFRNRGAKTFREALVACQ